MKTEIQNAFKCSPELLHGELRPLLESGSVFFYTYGSGRSHAHLQLVDGTIPCNRRPRFADGSFSVFEFDGSRFARYDFSAFGEKYGRTFDVFTIRNPVTCKDCLRWMEKKLVIKN